MSRMRAAAIRAMALASQALKGGRRCSSASRNSAWMRRAAVRASVVSSTTQG